MLYGRFEWRFPVMRDDEQGQLEIISDDRMRRAGPTHTSVCDHELLQWTARCFSEILADSVDGAVRYFMASGEKLQQAIEH